MMAERKLSHVDERGRARMVDVSDKPVTAREAVAEGFVELRADTVRAATRRGWSTTTRLSPARPPSSSICGT